MQRPALYSAQLINKTQITPKVVLLNIKLLSPPSMDFDAGKFVNLKSPSGKFRAYSIASDYATPHEIGLLIENGHRGVGSDYVNALTINDPIELIGPSGRFLLREPLPDHLVFFATGTGIAPLFAMFHKLEYINYQGKVAVFFGVRSPKLIIQKERLDYFTAHIKNFQYSIYTSQEQSPEYSFGRITSVLSPNLDKNAQYYVCGNPMMVDEICAKLHSYGVAEQDIIYEGFTFSAHK